MSHIDAKCVLRRRGNHSKRKEIKMDNEGLLEWAEYEVASAWRVLKRAEKHRDELRKAVDEEKPKKANDVIALVQRMCEFYNAEIERMKRENAFETRYGISEEEYYGYKNSV